MVLSQLNLCLSELLDLPLELLYIHLELFDIILVLQFFDLAFCDDLLVSHLLMDETLLKDLILANQISLSTLHLLYQLFLLVDCVGLVGMRVAIEHILSSTVRNDLDLFIVPHLDAVFILHFLHCLVVHLLLSFLLISLKLKLLLQFFHKL